MYQPPTHHAEFEKMLQIRDTLVLPCNILYLCVSNSLLKANIVMFVKTYVHTFAQFYTFIIHSNLHFLLFDKSQT